MELTHFVAERLISTVGPQGQCLAARLYHAEQLTWARALRLERGRRGSAGSSAISAESAMVDIRASQYRRLGSTSPDKKGQVNTYICSACDERCNLAVKPAAGCAIASNTRG